MFFQQKLKFKIFHLWKNLTNCETERIIEDLLEKSRKKLILQAFTTWRMKQNSIIKNPYRRKPHKMIEFKLLLLNLRNLIINRKKHCFFILAAAKENSHYESIIKNIVPLTNMSGLISIKLKENLIISFERILQTSQNSSFLKRFFILNIFIKVKLNLIKILSKKG